MATKSLGGLLRNADILQQAARLTGNFGVLNDTILQILREHLDKVKVRFAPKRPHDWDNHLAVLEVVYGEYTLKIPVPELKKMDGEVSRKVKRIMEQQQVNLRFSVGGFLFKATSVYRDGGRVSPLYRDQIFGLARNTDGLVEANDSHYDALDQAIDLTFAMHRVGDVGVYVDGVVHAAVLDQIEHLRFKPGAPIRKGSNTYWVVEFFKLVLEGRKVEVRSISRDERYDLIETWVVSEQEEWDKVLVKNKETPWSQVAESDEAGFVDSVVSRQVEAPVVWIRTWGVDTVIKATVWVLLPPDPMKGGVRVAERHYNRGAVVGQTIETVASDSKEAAGWLQFFASGLCQHPGDSVDFGYFVARLDRRATQYSNRISGGGNFTYGSHLGNKTG